MVHDGVMRRSEDEFSEVTRRGISPAVCMFIIEGEDVRLIRGWWLESRIVCESLGLILMGCGQTDYRFGGVFLDTAEKKPSVSANDLL
jgi:hypothetical protein